MTKNFHFSEDLLLEAKKIVNKYPRPRSAIMPLLYLVQRENDNWIPKEAMDSIAELLEIPPMWVYEVANFYTMYNKKPVGKYLVQLCRTTPCWLSGSNDLLEACKEELKIELGETSQDGLFTLVEVECLGACTAAPLVQINEDYYERLNKDKMKEIIKQLTVNNKD
jgi:NADH-quinone oxidoreductase subunit E